LLNGNTWLFITASTHVVVREKILAVELRFANACDQAVEVSVLVDPDFDLAGWRRCSLD
jgi:hypothetical protein